MVNYDKAKRRAESDEVKMRALREERDKLKAESEKLRIVLVSTMHEVRRFSGEISSHADTLVKVLQQDRAKDIAETLFYTSGLLAARLGFTDIELNPEIIRSQARVHAGIYKKFEKARYTLAQRAKSRGISIPFSGNSYFEIDALQSFELVPFVILDNAVKYSPDNQTVRVDFVESPREVDVEVRSIGPRLESEEAGTLFTRNGRGRNALKASIAGDGLGLYLAKVLCNIHGVQITAGSAGETVYQVKGVDYAEFVAQLRFRKYGQ
jgi:K+-sensing histidine kinase KdpD